MKNFLTQKVLVGIIVAAILLIFLLPLAIKEIDSQTRYNSTGGELVGDLKVGQTFFSIDKNIKRVSIFLSNYKNRSRNQDIIFHLKETKGDADIRKIIINASEIKDNVFHNFDFKPVNDSANKEYYFFIESPLSVPGNAITYRFMEGDAYNSGDLYINHEKRPGDLAFKTAYKESLFVVLKNELAKNPAKSLILLLFFLSSLIILATLFSKKIFTKKIHLILAIIILGLAIRLIYANYLPLTRDEGAYIYDGFLIKEGFVPFRDFFTRSPVLIYTLSVFVALTGKTFFAGRLLSIISSLSSALLLYLIGKKLFGNKVGKWALILFALLPSVILQTSYIHTQSYLIFLILTALYFFIRAHAAKNKNMFFVLSGVFLGLAVLVRHSAALYLFWEIILVFFAVKSLTKEKIRNSATLIAGFLISFVPIFFYLAVKSGFEKIWLTIGPGLLFRLSTSSEDVGGFLNIWISQKIPALFLIAEESLFLIFLGILFLGLFVFRFFKAPPKTAKTAVLIISSIFFILLFFGAKKMGERSEFSSASIIITFLGALWVLAAAKLFDYSKKIKVKQEKLGFLIPLIFIITPLLSYGLWAKFHPNYFSEFLIGLSLGGAIFLASLNIKNTSFFLKTIFSFLVVITVLFTSFFGLSLPHTGSFEISALKEARDYFIRNAAKEDEIFTSAVIIPFLSGNPLALNITHPTVYKYSWISQDIVAALGPTLTDIQNYLEEKKTPWVIVESQTRSDYFVGHDEFHKYINKNYELKKTIYNQIRNTPVPIDIYHRK